MSSFTSAVDAIRGLFDSVQNNHLLLFFLLAICAFSVVGLALKVVLTVVAKK